MNMPIYRAKDVHSNKYVEGLLSKAIIGGNEAYFIENWKKTRIDTTTLAIHFPDMLDSQGNKIFASLNEDGKGGDIVEYNGRQEIIKYSNGTIQTYMFRFEDLKELNFKAIGIQ